MENADCWEHQSAFIGHQDRVIDYLKIDIEFGEWDVFPELPKYGELSQVRQMGVEIYICLVTER